MLGAEYRTPPRREEHTYSDSFDREYPLAQLGSRKAKRSGSSMPVNRQPATGKEEFVSSIINVITRTRHEMLKGAATESGNPVKFEHRCSCWGQNIGLKVGKNIPILTVSIERTLLRSWAHVRRKSLEALNSDKERTEHTLS